MVAPEIHKEFILFMRKRFKLVIILFMVTTQNYLGQNVVKHYTKDSISFYLNQNKNPENKSIPINYSEAIRIALLHYPELNKTKITFRIRKKLAPLAARPRIFSIFLKPTKRKYLITISSSTIHMLKPILLVKLSFNAQIGVLGHELSHISEFNSKTGFFFVELVLKQLFSKRAIDRFEYATDMRCIEHGLGYQLLDWSTEVRQKLRLDKWGGANNPKAKRERYMNPETIISVMKAFPLPTLY